MASLLTNSIKISKDSKKDSKSNLTFTCGGCRKSYKSYPALYLHIKRKHQGIRPPNTKIVRPVQITQPTHQPVFVPTAQTGRPSKPVHNVDDLPYTELCLEETQNELLGFLGEKVMVIGGFEDKIKLEDVVNRILAIPRDNKDKWFIGVQDECKALFAEFGEEMNLDFEDEYRKLDPDDGFRALVWFLLWLGKYFVKREFIQDLSIVISKIWKILDETKLQIQDLDNKLVWKKAMAECKQTMGDLPCFKGDEELIYEFIQRTCQLIGKAFESVS